MLKDERVSVFDRIIFLRKQVQFLKKAVDILCHCRETLTYTYVFAYYLQKNNQSVIFEDNQKDLESTTERLSEYLERKITSENLTDIKQKVQDKYRWGDFFARPIVSEKNWWFRLRVNKKKFQSNFLIPNFFLSLISMNTNFSFIILFAGIIDCCRYCDSRRKVLLEHVHEGYEKEWWDYIE